MTNGKRKELSFYKPLGLNLQNKKQKLKKIYNFLSGMFDVGLELCSRFLTFFFWNSSRVVYIGIIRCTCCERLYCQQENSCLKELYCCLLYCVLHFRAFPCAYRYFYWKYRTTLSLCVGNKSSTRSLFLEVYFRCGFLWAGFIINTSLDAYSIDFTWKMSWISYA